MFTAFADVYDELMVDVDYAAWADFYAYMLQSAGVGSGAEIVECACGTGGLTLPLRRFGYRMTGVDISYDMLRIAAEKARREGITLPFVRQDMRQLRTHHPVDAVLCTCDGLNYFTAPTDAVMFFNSASAALKPGGCLVFDVSTPYKLAEILGDRVICHDSERVTYIWNNRYKTDTRILAMCLCVFKKITDGRYERVDETQKQRAHTREELTEWLQQAGFTDLRFYGEKAMRAPGKKEPRWHVCARKGMAAAL